MYKVQTKFASASRRRIIGLETSLSMMMIMIIMTAFPLSPDPTWTQLFPVGDIPHARVCDAVAYDSARGVLVLFGGRYGGQMDNLGDTWEFDGADWKDVTPIGESPSPRRQSTMAYDRSRDVVVLFGGEIGNNDLFGDTWEWDGYNKKWSNVKPLAGPSPRGGHSMVYDSWNNKIVLFGGYAETQGSKNWVSELWTWDGTTWERIPYGYGPSPRSSHGMAFDSRTGEVLIFGGCTGGNNTSNELWAWKDNTWMLKSVTGAMPSPRLDFLMAYFPETGQTIILGGWDFQSAISDAWAWNGSAWSPIDPPGHFFNPGEGEYFEARHSIVVFGGFDGSAYFNETWEYSIPNSAPIAVGKNIEINADQNCQATIRPADVDGGSSDPDGDPIELSVDNRGPFSLGCHPVFLTVTDSEGLYDTCEVTVTVVDATQPVPDVAQLPTVSGECMVEITTIPTATDNCQATISATTNDPLRYTEQGSYVVYWEYHDGHSAPVIHEQTVIVQDTTSPVLESLKATPDVLWPPFHQMVPVTVTAVLSDNCSGPLTFKILGVTSNEPENDLGDGETSPDWSIVNDNVVLLRAERSGNGTGRIYTIKVQGEDAVGNPVLGTVLVRVPKSQGKK